MSRIDITDNDLANFAAVPVSIEPDTIELSHAVFQRIVAELRERRAQDLTAEDIATLKYLRGCAMAETRRTRIPDRDRAFKLLDKLLGGGR